MPSDWLFSSQKQGHTLTWAESGGSVHQACFKIVGEVHILSTHVCAHSCILHWGLTRATCACRLYVCLIWCFLSSSDHVFVYTRLFRVKLYRQHRLHKKMFWLVPQFVKTNKNVFMVIDLPRKLMEQDITEGFKALQCAANIFVKALLWILLFKNVLSVDRLSFYSCCW